MNWVFFAPRFHTNQADLIRELVERGDRVTFVSARVGQSEDHTCLEPMLLRLGLLGIFPDFTWLYALASDMSARPCILVLRGLGLVNLFSGIIFSALGAKVILYTQGALVRPSIPVRLRIIRLLVIDLLGWSWFSPVKQRGIKEDGKVVDSRIKYIPFAKRVSTKGYVRVKGESLRLLSVGKLNRRKNHEAVIAAISDLPGVTLTVAGECQEPHQKAYLEELIALAGKLEPGKVVFATNTPHKLMEDLYLRHDVLTLCSYDEPASFSQLEAMACGLAVICNEDNGTASYVKHGRNGLVVDGSVSQIRKAILSYIEEPCQLTGHSVFSMADLRINHSPDRIIQQIEQA
jgi:glycosyltransferase involved in cell wall biosynthesis